MRLFHRWRFSPCAASWPPLCWPPKKPTELTGCAAKRQSISSQLEIAKAQGNSEQQAGLEKALDESDHPLHRCFTEKGAGKQGARRQARSQPPSGRPRQGDEKGDPDKINKRKEKLAESRKDLQSALDELDK